MIIWHFFFHFWDSCHNHSVWCRQWRPRKKQEKINLLPSNHILSSHYYKGDVFVKTWSPEHVQDLQLVSTPPVVSLDLHPIQHCGRKYWDICIFTKVTELSYKATTMEDTTEMVEPCIMWGTSRSENKRDL